MIDPQGTARERLIAVTMQVAAECDNWADEDFQCFGTMERYERDGAVILDAVLAHPADLLTVIAARGDLTEEWRIIDDRCDIDAYPSRSLAERQLPHRKQWYHPRIQSMVHSPWREAPTSEEAQ